VGTAPGTKVFLLLFLQKKKILVIFRIKEPKGRSFSALRHRGRVQPNIRPGRGFVNRQRN
jgi:hypothetical protein